MKDDLDQLYQYLEVLAAAGESLPVQDCGCITYDGPTQVNMRLRNQRGGTIPAADLLEDVRTLRAYAVFNPGGVTTASLRTLSSAAIGSPSHH